VKPSRHHPPLAGSLACALLLVTLHVLALWPTLSGTHTLWMGDTWFFILPYKVEAGRLLSGGAFPWRSTRMLGGQPLWAHPSAEVPDPTTLLFAWLSPESALGWATVFHGVLAGLGAHACARLLGAGRVASLWAAVAYSGSGVVLSLWSIKAVPSVGTPWLWAGALLLMFRTRAGMALCAASTAWLMLHPDPPMVLSAGSVALLLCAPRHRWRMVLACVAGVCAAAPFWWPALGVVLGSQRTDAAEFDAATTLGWRWVDLWGPGAFGVPGTAGALGGAARMLPGRTVVAGLYAGALLWAALGVRVAVRRKKTAVLALSAVVTLLLAHGNALPGMDALFGVLHARYPEKLLLVAALAAVLWAAVRWGTAQATWRPTALLVWMVLGGMVWGFAPSVVGRMLPPSAYADAAVDLMRNQVAVAVCLALLALAGMLLRGGALRTPTLLAVGCLEFLWCASVHLGQAPRGPFSPEAAVRVEGPTVACCGPTRVGGPGPTVSAPDDPPWVAIAENVQRHASLAPVIRGLSVPWGLDAGGFEPSGVRQALRQQMGLGVEEALLRLREAGVRSLVSLEPLPGATVMDHAPQATLYILELGRPSPAGQP
jgi:hypothetical protein